MTRAPGSAVESPSFDLHAFVRHLFPIARSLTGDGVRETLRAVAALSPLEIVEVASGTPVLDWEVPDEWNIRGATIRSLTGETLVDFADSNLHVMGYSQAVRGIFSREVLAAHVHTLPEQPEAIPYRTGYYARDWGFCIAHDVWSAMTDEAYKVEIDATLAPGALTYGEAFLPGSSDAEILISVHVCHPSLANDNLTGIALATALANRAARRPGRRLGLRFLFLPATIGAITWLARNEDRVGRIRHGLVLTCLGDAAPFHYKQSRSGAPIDRAVAHVLRHAGHPFAILPFSPYGYDERQYASPAFDLPVGCLMRGVHGTFPEYHTSLDNLDFVRPDSLDASFGVLCATLDLLDADRIYRRVDGRGEPQLGRRGLYRAIAGQKEAGGASQLDLLWFLNLADGRHSLLDIAERADIPFDRIAAAAALARDAHLVQEAP
jgi:aminopeptidase-like protein